MIYVRSIAMNTDHSFHGAPTEVTRVDLYVDEGVATPEVIKELKRLQVERLHHAAKRMPHRYWAHPESRPYASEGVESVDAQEKQR